MSFLIAAWLDVGPKFRFIKQEKSIIIKVNSSVQLSGRVNLAKNNTGQEILVIPHENQTDEEMHDDFIQGLLEIYKVEIEFFGEIYDVMKKIFDYDQFTQPNCYLENGKMLIILHSKDAVDDLCRKCADLGFKVRVI